MPTIITLLISLLVLLPIITRIYLLNPESPLHRSVAISGLILISLGILEYEIANIISLETVRYYALWHNLLSMLLLYMASSVAFYFAAPFSKLWKKVGLATGFLLAIPMIIIIYNLFFNGIVLNTNHEIISGEWQYDTNNERFIPLLKNVWVFIIAVYMALSHYFAYLHTSSKTDTILKLLLFIAFTIVPLVFIAQFIFPVLATDKGSYNLTPYIAIIFIIISWIYTNFRLFEINPTAAVDNILESMSDIIIITDNDLKIKYTNDTFERFGIYRKDILNQSLISFAKTYREISKEELNLIERLKKGEQKEQTLTFKVNGQNFHLLMTVSLVYNQQNTPVGYLFALTDLTETVEARNQLKDYSEQLEQSNKELERFAYVASHDMKSPLRNIISFLSLIERKLKNNPDKDIHEFINFASSNARYMHTLVQDILEFSKISKVHEQNDIVNLNDMLPEVINNLLEYINENNATINFEDLPTIKVNKVQIKQLFQNLIENGVKYNENENPTINIRMSKSKNVLKITFEDNGIGVSENFHEQIFDMFKRLHNNTVYQGTGIGLAICKKIMELHNGDIKISSNENHGSTFTLEFPTN